MKSEWQLYVQPDGSEISLLPVGDEYLHYFITTDSIPVIIEPDSDVACYARISEGRLISTGIVAHEKGMRGQEDVQAIADMPLPEQIGSVWRQRINDHQGSRINSLLPQRHQKGMALSFGDRRPTIGNKSGLIILVDFPNEKFTASHSPSFYNSMMNEEGYSDAQGHIGSVHDYFCAQSYGLFTPTFDVIGPVTMLNRYEYYGTDDGEDIDVKMGELVVEACSAVDDEVDFSRYDWDDDGEVDQVFIIYAGKGQATNPTNSFLIWPHMSSLMEMNGEKITLDGVLIDTYACCNERYGSNNLSMGIGTICHEFSHCLGLPDTYNTVLGTASVAGIPGNYDLMASGNYNGPNGKGEVPASLTAYGKFIAGWLDYKVLDGSQDVSRLASSLVSDDAYIIYNDACKDEYFVVENRQKKSWDSYIPFPGLTLLHIDFDQMAWENNEINGDNGFLRMSYVMSVEGYSPKYVFPYGSVKEVKESAMKLHNHNTDGTYLPHKSLTNIVQHADNTISFHFENNNILSGIGSHDKECRGMIKYFNLSGMFVGNELPAKSGIYIAEKDNRIHKIVVK